MVNLSVNMNEMDDCVNEMDDCETYNKILL